MALATTLSPNNEQNSTVLSTGPILPGDCHGLRLTLMKFLIIAKDSMYSYDDLSVPLTRKMLCSCFFYGQIIFTNKTNKADQRYRATKGLTQVLLRIL